jgi:hypothetical protein
MNFLMRLSVGLVTQIHGSERNGRRERDSQGSSRITEPYLFWMAWNRIEASLREAIRIAEEQGSVSLEKRAEATYTEYRRQKASASGGRSFRLPLC